MDVLFIVNQPIRREGKEILKICMHHISDFIRKLGGKMSILTKVDLLKCSFSQFSDKWLWITSRVSVILKINS